MSTPVHRGALRALARSGALVAGLLTALVLLPASTAAAAPVSQARATGLVGSVLGVGVNGTTGAVTSDGTTAGGGSTQTVAVPTSVGGAGVVYYAAKALPDGTSTACAGTGGATIDGSGTCNTPSGGSITIPLVAGTSLKADAVYARCTAGPGGVGATATAHVANLRVATALGTTALSVGASGSVDVLGLATVAVERTSTGDPSSATALRITLLGSGAVITVADVSCGPNTAPPAPSPAPTGTATDYPLPAVPVAGLPLLAAGLVGAAALGRGALARAGRAVLRREP